jgi:hypothetical protein
VADHPSDRLGAGLLGGLEDRPDGGHAMKARIAAGIMVRHFEGGVAVVSDWLRAPVTQRMIA